MKNIQRILFGLGLFLALSCPSWALNKTVSVTTSSTLVITPGSKVKTIVIQNPSGSAGSINVSIDGTAPTSSVGITIPSGQQLILNFTGAVGSGPNLIYAIALTGTTTIQVSTDDTQSS